MSLEKAVIPAAGRGTRMRPFSSLLAKELVPLGSTPALEWVLLEAASAGLRQIALIVREGKESIGQFVDSLLDDRRFAELEVSYLHQNEPTGLADALLTARDFTGDDPFAVLLPDNVLLGTGDSLARMRAAFEQSGQNVVGVVEVPASRSGEFGHCGLFEAAERADGLLQIERLLPRQSGRLLVAEGSRTRRTCGRFIAHPHLHDHLLASRRQQPEGELDEMPAFSSLLPIHGLVGCKLLDPLFDVGHPSGVLAASAHLHASRRSAGAARAS